MKKKYGVSFTLFFFYQLSFGQLKIDKQHFIDLLNNRNYKQAYEELTAIQEQPCGKCCLTDYLIGKSLCLSGLKEPALSRYANILTNYKQLPDATKTFIIQESGNCAPETNMLSDQTNSNIRVFPMGPAGVTGKLGMVYNCFQKYEAVHIIREVPEEEFSSRLFPVTQPDDAIKKIQSIIPPGYSVFQKDNFILVTAKGPDTTKIKRGEIVDELVKTLHFYSTYYGLRLPDKLITAYIVPDNKSLQVIAKAVHGISVPKENYGYSLLPDLSIIGISNFLGIGTLRHELFHIVVRGDIGDVPAWLDEGISTLYEESHWNPAKNVLVSDTAFWRRKVLQKALTGFHLYSKLPDLKTLVNYAWTQFEASDNGDICKASVDYAFAKHFVAYLEQTGQLKAVLDAFKNKRGPNKEDVLKSNSEVLEIACNKPIQTIEEDFDKWLIEKFQLSILDPFFQSNRFGPGEPESIPAVIEFKKNMRMAQAAYARLSDSADTSAISLKQQIDSYSDLFKAETAQFDMRLLELYNKNQGHKDESALADASYFFVRKMQEMNSHFQPVLRQYTH